MIVGRHIDMGEIDPTAALRTPEPQDEDRIRVAFLPRFGASALDDQAIRNDQDDPARDHAIKDHELSTHFSADGHAGADHVGLLCQEGVGLKVARIGPVLQERARLSASLFTRISHLVRKRRRFTRYALLSEP